MGMVDSSLLLVFLGTNRKKAKDRYTRIATVTHMLMLTQEFLDLPFRGFREDLP